MRLKIKIKVLELIDTVKEGIEYIKQINMEPIKSKNMLEDCVLALNSIFNITNQEKIEYIIKNIIELQNYNHEEEINNTINNIYAELNELKRVITYDIETQLEIVFMPYKVSMWDSLESIWESAIHDPNCNCHVVPIPYYELDSERNIRKICYEGDKFNKNIKITHYSKYCFEKIEPDIIYIHNPYDEYNRLTMIDPRYFSSNLAKYTNMLVYVPYFIAGSYKNIEASRNMYMTPGCVNANKIIAQSYQHRDTLLANGYSTEKILNLGSPKIDFIVNKNNYNDKVSENTESKKTFLLSTGISDMLSFENWIDRIVDLVNCFIKNKEIMLIWRLHPLTEATVLTMRKELIHKFEDLYNKIKDADNITIDTSDEINHSINMSDALISDYSSVMFQYIATQKPVFSLIQNELTELNRIYCVDYLGTYSENEMDINEFIELVVDSNDYKKEERMERFKNSITNYQGNSGEKIHYAIKKEIYI